MVRTGCCLRPAPGGGTSRRSNTSWTGSPMIARRLWRGRPAQSASRPGGPACCRAKFLARPALGVARQSVIRDRFPGRRISDELPELWTDAGVPIDCSKPYAGLGVVVGVTGEDRRAALAAEPFLMAVPGLPGSQNRLPTHDPKGAGNDCGVRRSCGSRPPLAAGAVAVARAEQRLRDLKAHSPTVATTGKRIWHGRDPKGSHGGPPPSPGCTSMRASPPGQRNTNSASRTETRRSSPSVSTTGTVEAVGHLPELARSLTTGRITKKSASTNAKTTRYAIIRWRLIRRGIIPSLRHD